MAKSILHFIAILYKNIYEADASEISELDKTSGKRNATGRCNQHPPLSVQPLWFTDAEGLPYNVGVMWLSGLSGLRFFQPFPPAEGLAISLLLWELISKGSFKHQLSLAGTSQICMVLLLLLGTADFPSMGISRTLWEKLNPSTKLQEMSLLSHYRNAKLNFWQINGKFHPVNFWPGTLSAKIRKYYPL